MKTILVVDDEKDIRDLLEKKLTQNNYKAITAASGQETLDTCATFQPDLILLDIAMPVMDGYQVCKKLRENKKTQDIPILFLTGKDLEPQGIIERYKTLGACGFIEKPSTIKDLLEKINEIIG